MCFLLTACKDLLRIGRETTQWLTLICSATFNNGTRALQACRCDREQRAPNVTDP